ncbi:hypothetical protein FW778_13875 [Ginsengibacter hankyongi]|uniref:Uncharacterized protein n=1 Tax=Ginsengibacter hankyongi TaxID=2607284 RepID=A0A5J5IHA9_9BACT|nr:DUF6266 family protein [Ginsengibacter hankyongi]KAA9038636.1 hypothetical protein FW778_13875 [Ginsengibacter hankyongi]
MATIPSGILGHFIGKAGNVSGYMRNGKNFLRSRPRKSRKPASPARLAQQQKIKVCGEFTRAFTGTGFFNITFPAYGHTGSGYNRATSALLNLAITGAYPDTALSYAQVLVSKGQLPPAQDATATNDAEGNIYFNWTDNSGDGTAKKNDRAIMVAYSPETKQAVFAFSDAERKDEMAILGTGSIKGAVQTWLGFLSADETHAANSVYTGELVLSKI